MKYQETKLWNGVNVAYRRRTANLGKRARAKRQGAGSPSATINNRVDFEHANMTGPKYFVDLYRNLSISTQHIQANTIRSLPYFTEGEEKERGREGGGKWMLAS